MKKKILFTNGHLDTGGCEKSLVNLLNSIDYNKYDVDLVLFERYGEYTIDLPKAVNVELIDLSIAYGSFKKVLLQCYRSKTLNAIIIKIILTFSQKISNRFISFLRFFKKEKKQYDIAIAYRVGVAADFVSYAVKAKKKFVWWHHGIFEPFLAYRKAISNNFRLSDKVICVSEASEKMIRPFFPEFPHKFDHLSNIVCKEEIIYKATQFNPYSKKSRIVIVSVSRFAPEKRLDYIVYIAKNLVNMGFENFVWYLVGDGRKKEEVSCLIQKNNLSNYVVLLGNQNNPYPYINYADIFVHPSPVESQGIVVLEAMALNKICVINRSIGTDEFVVDGVNGIQSENSVDCLTEKVKYAINNYKTLDFSKAQNETLLHFSPETLIEKFYSIVDS